MLVFFVARDYKLSFVSKDHGIIQTLIFFSYLFFFHTQPTYTIFKRNQILFFGGVFTTLSAILAISWRPVLVVKDVGVLERTTDQGQATGKLYHLQFQVECTLFVMYTAGCEPTPYWCLVCMSCQVIQLSNTLSHPGPKKNQSTLYNFTRNVL